MLPYPTARALAMPSPQPLLGPVLHLPPALDVRTAVSTGAFALTLAVFWALAVLFLLFVLRLIVRSERIAAIVCVLILTVWSTLQSDMPLLSGVANLLQHSAGVFVLVRFGFLPIVATMTTLWGLGGGLPVTTDFTAWYSGLGLAGIAIAVGVAVYAFRISLGGQPILGSLGTDN
jgi:hypothetical protein